MKLNWKHLFDWSVVSVTEPVAVNNKRGAIVGYTVEVNYAHHGKRNLFFGIDADSWYHQYGSPVEAARTFYNKYNAQAKEWQKRSVQQAKVK